MDDFGKYLDLRDRGAGPREVYQAARADGLVEIDCIRLVRSAFGLSLREAKEVTGAAEALGAPQPVVPGSRVYWEGWDSLEGPYLMEATVRSVREGTAELEGHRKYCIAPEGLEEVPVRGPVLSSARVSYFEKPLAERLANLVTFLDALTGINDTPADGASREAV